jgi:hypothetical protein
MRCKVNSAAFVSANMPQRDEHIVDCFANMTTKASCWQRYSLDKTQNGGVFILTNILVSF